MMRLNRYLIVTGVGIVAVLSSQLTANAFKIETHDLINKSAVENSNLANFFTELGRPPFFVCDPADSQCVSELLFKEFPNGIDQLMNGQRVVQWIQNGGIAEDMFLQDVVGPTLGEDLGALFRSTRHFHTPLKPWDQAGLNILGVQFQSAVQWAQNPNQARKFGVRHNNDYNLSNFPLSAAAATAIVLDSRPGFITQ